jgi:hypothetical protein
VSKAGTTSTDAVAAVTLVGPADAASRKAVKRAAALGDAVAYTRDLVNLPPNLLYPQTFVDSLTDRIKGTKVKLKSYDMKALRAGGFGGTVGVGQGSANEPRIAVLSYSPSRPKASIAFVGKGITFDSGGLCIKPANGMVTMKCDMAGAAAVAGAVLAIAERRRDDARRQDRRGAQHRRRGTHGARRLPRARVRVEAGRDRRRRDADRCAGHRARQHGRGHGQRRGLPHARARRGRIGG